MQRLFTALDLPFSLQRSLDTVRGGVEAAHWQRDQQLHLTLGFFGDVDRRSTHDLIDELARITVSPFLLQLEGVGQFGKEGRVKTLWAGVADPKPLAHLHEKISQCARRVGVSVDERRFKPHVTVARFRRGACPNIGPWLHDNENLLSPAELVGHFTLFSSHQTREGSHFRAEARFGQQLASHSDQDHDMMALDHADVDDWRDEVALWEQSLAARA